MAAISVSSAGKAVLIVGWSLLPVSLTVLVLRLFTKLAIVHRRLTLDDLLIAAGFAVQAGYNAIFTLAVFWGLGRHLNELDAEHRLNALKWIVISEPFAVVSSMFARVGFAIYLLDLIGPRDSRQRWVLQVIVMVQLLANTATVVQILAQCGSQVAAQWDPDVAAFAKCQSPLVETYFGYVQSSLNSVCDLTLTVIPLLVIKRLQISTRVKFGLLGLLCLSLFALIASIIKTVAIANLSVRNNLTYNMAFLVICCTVENNLVIIGASIPTLKPLLNKVTGTVTRQTYGSDLTSKRAERWKSDSTRHLRADTETIRCKTDVTVVLEDVDNRREGHSSRWAQGRGGRFSSRQIKP